MAALFAAWNAPAFRLEVDGVDVSARIEARLISLSMMDNRGLEADDLTIELSDHDGALALPKLGGEARLWLGWKGQALTDKGSFVIDELGWSGAPGRLSITARSVNLREKMNVKKERSWHKTSLGTIVRAIADEAGIDALTAPELARIDIEHKDQTNESDASFLTRLAREFDAIATAKKGKLLFFRAGASSTVTGKSLPAAIITLASGDQPRITIANRNAYRKVEAFWLDRASGKKKKVVFRKKEGAEDEIELVGKKPQETTPVRRPRKGQQLQSKRDIAASGDKNAYTMRHIFASEAEAKQAAIATWKRLQRGRIGFSINLAMGRADLFPELPVSVEGVKAEMDQLDWIITKVAHSLGDGGFTTALELELKDDAQAEEDDGGGASDDDDAEDAEGGNDAD